ncbi:MAG: substrate-binding domain-containing protein [Methanosarcinaceae archaeon]|nr:substrate-binding domain-containing protein [Methanosarcinaceae archaeon]
MKKLCALTLIFILLLTAAGSGCADKASSGPVSEDPASNPESGQVPENPENPFEGKELSVCAGAGLIKPMNELVSGFENRTGADIQVRYGGSAEIFGILVAQECDVFIPGAYYYTGQAMGRHYVFNESVTNLTLHIPVIAVPRGNPGNISGLEDLAKPGIKLALGDPKGPAIGKVAEKICGKCGILPEVENNTIVRTATVNQLLIYIVTGQADATIIWEDMANWGEASGKLETIPIPAEQNSIKTIPTAVSVYTEEPELAEAFNTYIASEEAAASWEKWGFKPCSS